MQCRGSAAASVAHAAGLAGSRRSAWPDRGSNSRRVLAGDHEIERFRQHAARHVVIDHLFSTRSRANLKGTVPSDLNQGKGDAFAEGAVADMGRSLAELEADREDQVRPIAWLERWREFPRRLLSP
jgi:hypothetical protein